MEQPSTILIVDDETLGRETLGDLLSNRGYDIAFATNGIEALEKVAELTPDLILLDVMMPGIDGFEVCARLRAAPFFSEVPIIMLTALDDRDSRLQGIKAGADDFISKPFDHVELRTRVRTITRLNRYRRLLSERMKFEWVATQAQDGYLIVDDDGGVLYANPKARLYLGLSTDQNAPITETFQMLVKKQYRCEPQSAWATWPKQSAKTSPRYLVRPETSTTSAFWLQVDILKPPSGPDWIIHLRDVTKQLALQRGTYGFHQLIMHKLRTPLIGMLGSQELLARHAPKLSSHEIAELAQTTHKNMKRLQGQIEDVLQYLQSPNQAQEGAKFDLSQLQSIATQISTALDLKSVEVNQPEHSNGVQTVLTQQAMELILWEVLENAKKFHPDQAPNVKILVSQPGPDQINIKIVDDGLNVSPEQLEQMWHPYYQGEKYFTGEAAGMGLGLPLVASLVWNVGGSCYSYNRNDGSGLVIELILPLDTASDHRS